MTRPEPAGDGLLLLDKPAGRTSHDVVSTCRWLCATRKVGHAGTLDPMATGVLIVGVGRATRLLTYLVGQPKTYRATIRLGEATTTEDADGEVVAAPGWPVSGGNPVVDRPPDVSALDSDGAIREAMSRLTGVIDQVPSAVSAKKVAGRRAYERVRAGEEVRLAPQRVEVPRFEARGLTWATGVSGAQVADLQVEVEVSSGTYIRALARDVGELLGSAAHLTVLRRTEVGPFGVEEVLQLPDLVARREAGALPKELSLMTMGEAAQKVLPVVRVDERATSGAIHGQAVRGDLDSPQNGPSGHVALIDQAGALVAVAAASSERQGWWQPRTVFAAPGH